MSTAVETIKNFMGVLKNYSQDTTAIGRIALDDATRQTTVFSSLKEATVALQKMLGDTNAEPDSDTRLLKATGMVLGAYNDYSVDTGAITGANAGGSTIKNAQSIVPEISDLSTVGLPTPGSTTPITYTGEDGNTFTFYVKWPDSFTTVVNGLAQSDDTIEVRVADSRYYVDLDTLDPNGTYDLDTQYSGSTAKSATFGEMKSAIQTALKGLNAYWLRESAKLNYDSLGLALDGQTIEISFGAGGNFDGLSAVTIPTHDDGLPVDHIYLSISLSAYGRLNPTDPNGSTDVDNSGISDLYLDRVIAHEMVHAVMAATGTMKDNMPQFFTEGIADLVQGDDDDNSEQVSKMRTLVNNPDTLKKALEFLEGTGSEYAYPAGDMLMRFIAQQSLDLTPIVGDPSQAQIFDYSTKSAVITNYTEADSINYTNDFRSISSSLTNNDLVIEYMPEGATSIYDEGILVVRDVRGKTVTLNTASGTAYAYMASNAGELEGRNFGGGSSYAVLFGADYANDTIRAGNAGSYLWGGHMGDDNLFGGWGEDVFVYNYGDAHDTINDASSQDIVRLNDISLETISFAQINDNGVVLNFTDGGSLNVYGTPSTFILDDEQTTVYIPDYQNKTWTQQS